MNHTLPKLIGVIHLPALPGSPGAVHQTSSVALQKALSLALTEVKIYDAAGFDGIIIENFGDAPFYKTHVQPETIASMSIIASAIRNATKMKLGINVLRNDSFAALAIAAVSGANFIRVNVLSGVVATDQGLIEGNAAELLRERLRLNAAHVGILADVHVKHAKTLSSSSIALSIEETAGRGGADGIIITGDTTGRSPDKVRLNEAVVAAAHSGVPLYIGSGMTEEGLKEISKKNVRIIVGSALRKGGKAGAALQLRRAKRFCQIFKIGSLLT